MADRFPIIIESTEQQIQELSAGDGLDLTKSGVVNANYVHSAGVNVGVVTATSFIGDGSQITNIPAGGGSLEATASGTLADGSKVIVNTDGTVSVVTQSETTGAGFGVPGVYHQGSGQNWSIGPASTAYDSSTGKVVIAYYDGSTTQGRAVVGTVSGTSITFGSPSAFLTQYLDQNASVAFVGSGKFVVTYRNSGSPYYGRVRVGTISGDSISFSSQQTFYSGTVSGQGVAYDSANDRIVIAYRDEDNNDYGRAVVGQVSGTNITFGTPSTFNSASTRYMQAVYDSDNGRVVIVYRDDGNSDLGTAVVGQVNSSNNTITFGSDTAFGSGGQSNYLAATYTTSGKVVVVYQDRGNSVNYSAGTAAVGTVNAGNNTISFGTPVVFETDEVGFNAVTYNSSTSKVVVVYQDEGNSNYGTKIEGTISGTSINFDSPSIYSKNGSTPLNSAVYDSTNNKVVIAYVDQGNETRATAIVSGHAGFPVPQVGTPSPYASNDTNFTAAVYDSTNNKVVAAYWDPGNNYYGTAVVGTVSGTSISFGSPTVFNSDWTRDIRLAYDSTNNKVIAAYKTTNSYYGAAVVGQVNSSNNTITFGTPNTFSSSNTNKPIPVYDSANDKVVIVYEDVGNSSHGKAIVVTVSGTSITYGSPVTWRSYSSYNIGATFDSTNGKIVVGFQDYGANAHGSAIVLEVSGTSINYGSPVKYVTSIVDMPHELVHDPVNNKVVILYRNSGDQTYYGTAIVGEVSGTAISFNGTATAFNPTYLSGFSSVVYDSTNGKIVIFHQDNPTTSGKAIVGTISGNNISFGSPFEVESDRPDYPSAVYDSSNDKVVAVYSDSGNSYRATATVFTPFTISRNLTSENFIGISDGSYTNGQTATIQIAGSVDDAQSSLTPGQQYYVQNDGTLSETADTPSVLAGTAVAATKLMIG